VDRLDKDALVPPNQAGAGLTPAQERALLEGMTVQPKLRPQSMAAFGSKLFPEYFPPTGDDRPMVTDPGPVPVPGPSGSKIPQDKLPLVIGLGIFGVGLSLILLVLSIILVVNL
jgi:hypothetical protein